MELRITGTEKELAAFIMFLGKAEAIAPSVKAEIKTDKPKSKAVTNVDSSEKIVSNVVTRTVPTEAVAKHFGVTGQTIRNYTKFGLPYTEKNKKKLYNLNEATEWIAKYQKKHKTTHNRGKKYTTKRSKPTVIKQSEYSKWCEEITEMCRKAGKDKGKSLSITYKLMTQRYGIVWDQLKKEFYNDNGYSSNATLELAYYLEQKNKACKNLLKGVLSNVLEGKY